MTDWSARKYDARELMRAPRPPCSGQHRWVDVNDLPDPELLVCYRCGHSKPSSVPLAAQVAPTTVRGTTE